jgi:hypothetical protein
MPRFYLTVILYAAILSRAKNIVAKHLLFVPLGLRNFIYPYVSLFNNKNQDYACKNHPISVV